MRYLVLFTWMLLPIASAEAADPPLPIFDAHIHYSEDVWESLPPAQALRKLTEAGIGRAVVSSTPTEGTERLWALAPERVVPFLRPYPTPAHRYTWFKDPAVPNYIRVHLEGVPYRGVGEFHVFGADTTTEVMREILSLVRQRRLAVHAHTDLEGLQAILRQVADVPVIWAHSGFDVSTETLRMLLDRHSQLYLELSFRHGMTTDGRLTPEWIGLLTERRHRFLVGMDTYTPTRWAELSELAEDARQWLRQLPAAVADDIAYGNAERLFRQAGVEN